MRLDFENSKSVWNSEAKMAATDVEHKSALELFAEFFETQNNVPMTIDQIEIMQNLFEEMAGDKE
jgi:exonuclease SbcD